MKYVLTGSVGHITKPVAENLSKAGHDVSIITSNPANEAAIKALGATPLTGSVSDVAFLSTSFKGADVVYLMIPPTWAPTDWLAHMQGISNNYIAAINNSGVKKIVVLSSVGAHMGRGAGPVDGLAYLESKINELPGVDAVYLRPSYFYYNLFSMIPMIKNAGIMGSNQPSTHKLVLTHTKDIADAATAQLLNPSFSGKKVLYIGSDARTLNEITSVLGKAIGKENIPWVEFTDEQQLNGMLQAGLNPSIAKGYTEMGAALRSGEMESDYWKNKANAVEGKIKLEAFAKEFAAAYNS